MSIKTSLLHAKNQNCMCSSWLIYKYVSSEHLNPLYNDYAKYTTFLVDLHIVNSKKGCTTNTLSHNCNSKTHLNMSHTD